MYWLDQLKLLFRARKYRYRNDPGEIAYLLTKVSKGDTVFDIGAHKGAYLFYLRRTVGKSGQVVAFEPQTILQNYLKNLVKAFAWTNVRVEHLALSEQAGELTLYIPAHKKKNRTSPGASLIPHADGTPAIATEKVKVQSLDAYCKAMQLWPSFLKIDVEGNELPLFKGAVELLKNKHPKILVEIEARHIGQEKATETFRFLENLGYKAYFIEGMQLRPLAEFSFEEHQNPDKKASYCNNFVFE